MARVYALSIHADYGCRHSGACCATGWDVPVETPLYRTLAEAVEGGRLHPSNAPAEGAFIVGSSRVDLQACKLEYSIVSPK